MVYEDIWPIGPINGYAKASKSLLL
uniref:Uncharacterized protein n=1 Tax=Rhizophora mucronata TaxID=61149 RepID=A0A2P2N920_RHIMU